MAVIAVAMKEHTMQRHAGVPLTEEAIASLREELDYLRTTRRREVADLLREQRENEDPSDAIPEDDTLRNERAFVEGRILEVEQLLSRARVIDREAVRRAGRVEIGSTVVVQDGRGRRRTYTLVASAESNPAQGKISDASPVGRALIHAKPGDTVTVQAPTGPQTLTVEQIG